MKKTILNQYAEIRNSLTTFSSPYFSFIGVVRMSINDDTGAMSEEQEMELEAVCLSRLYFALNRIQGSLQIDKKKRRETSILECSKSRNDTCTKKDKMKRKHSSGVRKCRRRERSASWMESREFTIFTFTGSRTIRAEFITRFEFGGETRWRAVQTRFRPIGRPIVL